MELVPFVYIALIIAAVLTLATLVISYLSFKRKQNEPKKEPAKPNIIPLSQAAPNPYNKVVVHNTNPEKKAPPVSPADKKLRTEILVKKEVKKPPKEKKIDNERIQIIKDLSPKRKKEMGSKKTGPTDKKKNERMNTLGEDVLGKYEEKNGDDFYSLNIPDDKE